MPFYPLLQEAFPDMPQPEASVCFLDPHGSVSTPNWEPFLSISMLAAWYRTQHEGETHEHAQMNA